jgi:hypothetical protein
MNTVRVRHHRLIRSSRWYGKKIYHMLLSHDELDSMMKHYLNATVYTNMCEVLENIRTKVNEPIQDKTHHIDYSMILLN